MVRVIEVCTYMESISGKPYESSAMNQGNVSSIEKKISFPTPMHEDFDTLNIKSQAQSFASSVIQTCWRGFSCRKKRSFLLGCSKDYRSTQAFRGRETITQSKTCSPTSDVNDRTLVGNSKSVTKLRTAASYRKDDVLRGNKSSADNKEEQFNPVSKNSYTTRDMKKRVVKKVPCVTLNFEAATVPKGAGSPSVPSIKTDRKLKEDEPRCVSSQSHKRMPKRHTTITSNNGSFQSRPKTAMLSRPQVGNVRKGSFLPSSASASTRLESAINSFLQHRQKKKEENVTTVDKYSTAEPEIATAKMNETEKITSSSATTLPVSDPSDRFTSLLAKLRSLNTKN